MKTELVTTLKRKATDIIAGVAKSRDPVLITQHGRPAAYLVDVETFEGLNERLAVLETISRGERAVQEGRVLSHKDVKKETGAMVQVVWTDPAAGDLDAIADYIALDKPDAASRFVRRVYERVEMLAEHPEIGSRVPEVLRSSHYRQLVDPPCRVFYRYDKIRKMVLILGVMRGEKLFQKRLLQERDKLG